MSPTSPPRWPASTSRAPTAARCWRRFATTSISRPRVFPTWACARATSRHPHALPSRRLRRRARLRAARATEPGRGALGRAHGGRQGARHPPSPSKAQRLLRLEKGHIIIGQDTDGLTTPHEADMAWALARKKPFHVGIRSVRMHAAKGLTRKLVGFEMPGVGVEQPKECHLVIRGSRDHRAHHLDRLLAQPRQDHRPRLRGTRSERARHPHRDQGGRRAHGERHGGEAPVLRPRRRAAGALSVTTPAEQTRRSPLLPRAGGARRALRGRERLRDRAGLRAGRRRRGGRGAIAGPRRSHAPPAHRLQGLEHRSLAQRRRRRDGRGEQPGLRPGRRHAHRPARARRSPGAGRAHRRRRPGRNAGRGLEHGGGRRLLPRRPRRDELLAGAHRRARARHARQGLRRRPQATGVRARRYRADQRRPPQRHRDPGRHRRGAGLRPRSPTWPRRSTSGVRCSMRSRSTTAPRSGSAPSALLLDPDDPASS